MVSGTEKTLWEANFTFRALIDAEMNDVPANAPKHCPGTQSDEAGRAAPCAGCPNQQVCASGEAKQVEVGLEEIATRMATIKHKILVLSGKGGVGKSSVSSMIARVLAGKNEDKQVALLDIDICGPSQPRILGVEKQSVHQSGVGWQPVPVTANLCVMSIGFLLDNRNDSIVWRGPRKNAMIKQFLKDVYWDELDYLIIDTPPDEHISIARYLISTTTVDGAILVTTPQEIALLDVRKEANFCAKMNIPILGIVENMSAFVCPCCNNATVLFPATTGGGEALAKQLNVPFLGRVPLDARLAQCMDTGEDFTEKHGESPTAQAFNYVVQKLVEGVNAQQGSDGVEMST